MEQAPYVECSIHDVYMLLFRLGGTSGHHGYYHTAYAIYLCVQQPERLLLATKCLYPMVAKEYHTNWQSVERNIRTFISRIWNENPALLEEIAQRPLHTRPTPKQFISIIATHLRLEKTA